MFSYFKNRPCDQSWCCNLSCVLESVTHDLQKVGVIIVFFPEQLKEQFSVMGCGNTIAKVCLTLASYSAGNKTDHLRKYVGVCYVCVFLHKDVHIIEYFNVNVSSFFPMYVCVYLCVCTQGTSCTQPVCE